MRVRSILRRLHGTRSATAIEDGLTAALTAVAAIAAMHGSGNQLDRTFSNLSSTMKAT